MRILYITSNRVGDAILASGVLRALYEDHPNAHYTIVAGPAAIGLFEGFPGQKKLIAMRKKRSRGLHWPMLWLQVAPFVWDIIIDFRDSMISYTVLHKRNFRSPRGRGYLHRVPLAGAAIGREDDPPAPKIWTSEKQRQEAEAYFSHLSDPNRKTLCIGPTANWQGKIWPIEFFVELAKSLTAEGAPFADAALAVIGGPGEQDQAAPLLEILPKERTIDLVGTPLGVAAASIEKCSLYIGNDSGLMHMAAAVKVPTVGLFGPSRDWLYSPWGDHCTHVRTPESFEELIKKPDYNRHTTASLMKSLSVDLVRETTLAHLKKLETAD